MMEGPGRREISCAVLLADEKQETRNKRTSALFQQPFELAQSTLRKESSFSFFILSMVQSLQDDPRDSSLETKFTIPQTWRGQDNVGSCLF